MLQEIFYWVFNMSITAAIAGILILPVRKLKVIPKRVAVFLWLIPFMRMTVPFGMNSPYSLMTLLSKVATKTVIVYQPAQNVAFSMTNCAMAADTYFPVTYKTNLLEEVFGVAAMIWLIVALAILLMMAAVYWTTLREIKDAAHFRDNIYVSEKVTTPAVYGIVKPRIVLPAAEQKNLEMILLHEQMHIGRRDNLWRLLAFVTAAVHWFNPLSWVFLKTLLADLELACDECALTKLGKDRAKEYALSLLESKQGATVFASAFGGAKIRTRIENILSYRKLSWFAMAAFAALTGVMFYVLLTNAG